MQDSETIRSASTNDRLVDHLGALFEHADRRITRVDERSYRNLQYLLGIFAAAVGLSFRLAGQPKGQALVALITLCLLIVGDVAEGRYMQDIAQWRERRSNFAANKLRVIEGKEAVREQLDSEHPVAANTQRRLMRGRQLVYHLLALGALAALIEAVRKIIA